MPPPHKQKEVALPPPPLLLHALQPPPAAQAQSLDRPAQQGLLSLHWVDHYVLVLHGLPLDEAGAEAFPARQIDVQGGKRAVVCVDEQAVKNKISAAAYDGTVLFAFS